LEINLAYIITQESPLQHILNGLADGVVLANNEGRIFCFNHAAERITGITSDKACGKTLETVFDAQITDVDAGALSETANDCAGEVQMTLPDTDTRHVRFSISSITGIDGILLGRILMLQDITQIKKLQEQANRSGRLSAMGEMAVKIAHEIRNPLGSIELFATLLRKELAADNEKKIIAEHISSGVRSINNIITNLLFFIRPEQKPERQVVDIHDCLQDSLFFAEHQINANSGIEVITNFAPHALTVYGDSDLLGQVALNLILNAIQAMPDGGQMTVSTRMTNDPYGQEVAEIRFADSGCGIPKRNFAQIFDPFFTTKKRGTGLGLAIVHNITKDHGGSIDIKSSQATGTECIVTLPLWQHNAPAQCKPSTELI
jgi:PAS domain S-box-containing protein